MPKEFGGKGRFPCPHEILFSSVGACLLVTFLRIAQDMSLNLKGLEVSVKGKVDWRGHNIESVEVVIRPEVEEEEKWEAEECIRVTEKYCPIKYSLKPAFTTKVSADVQVRGKSLH